jgi:hypothetical protein
MPWRFRKSFNPLPGVRINLSPRGLSTSVGVGPLRIYAGRQGTALTARIPGTGIAYRQPLTPGSKTQGVPNSQTGDWDSQPHTPPLVSNLGEIASAGTSELTSEGLVQFTELLTKAQEQRSSVLRDLEQAASESSRTSDEYTAWKGGWFLRRVLRKRFEQLEKDAAEWQARYAELQEQEALSRLRTEFSIPDSVRGAFSRLSNSFVAMANCSKIWDTISSVTTDRSRERTSASSAITRREVRFSLAKCDLIESELNVPHLANANGGDLFFYPGFLLYYISQESFALIEVAQVKMVFELSPFLEEEAVPPDSRIVRHTWKKVNKDGSPDRRFANNYQIPIAEYGDLTITSATGIREQYMLSNAEVTRKFVAQWIELQNTIVLPNADQ